MHSTWNTRSWQREGRKLNCAQQVKDKGERNRKQRRSERGKGGQRAEERERENGGASASIIRKERLWTFSDIEKEEEE